MDNVSVYNLISIFTLSIGLKYRQSLIIIIILRPSYFWGLGERMRHWIRISLRREKRLYRLLDGSGSSIKMNMGGGFIFDSLMAMTESG